jgi:hypothetical protein
VSLAWHLAIWFRCDPKKFPRLQDVLTRQTGDECARQRGAERRAAWEFIAASFGGTFKPFDKHNPKRRIVRG